MKPTIAAEEKGALKNLMKEYRMRNIKEYWDR